MEPIDIKFPDFKHPTQPQHQLKPLPETVDFEAMPAHTPKIDPQNRLRHTIGRELVAVLRHTAVERGLEVRDDGFVALKSILQLNSKLKKANVEMVKQIVAENDKKRLELIQEPSGEYFIRAVQGHTIKTIDDEKLLKKIESPKELAGVTVVHGTTNEAWEFIRKTGLNKMARNHIHFARGYPGDKEVISGMRTTCSVFIEIDVPLAMHNGIRFYESNNGVILSSGINGVILPIYFKHVYQVDEKTRERKRVFGNDNIEALKSEFMYRYLFVLDFEANCQQGEQLDPQEIIEFPVVVVDTKVNAIVKEFTFHTYIKPDVHKLTPFCTELTGITQELVDSKGIPLAEALKKFHQWATALEFNLDECCFVTCGLWDLKTCLKNEAAFRKIDLDPFFKRFVNLKEVFSITYGFKDSRFGMVDMLDELEIEQKGRHHSGIDDSFNIAEIVVQMGRQDRFLTRNFTRFVSS